MFGSVVPWDFHEFPHVASDSGIHEAICTGQCAEGGHFEFRASELPSTGPGDCWVTSCWRSSGWCWNLAMEKHHLRSLKVLWVQSYSTVASPIINSPQKLGFFGLPHCISQILVILELSWLVLSSFVVGFLSICDDYECWLSDPWICLVHRWVAQPFKQCTINLKRWVWRSACSFDWSMPVMPGKYGKIIYPLVI